MAQEIISNTDTAFEELKKKVLSYNSAFNIDKLTQAYLLAKEAHKGQCRNSGEAYLHHPLSVAAILSEYELDCDTITSALLHDVVEDTSVTLDDIREKFGNNVCDIVDGVTKLDKIKYTSKEDQQVENLRKMFLAMAKDVRVILVKLADRLHNMRTMQSMPPDKQREKARETLEVYAALANRLGMLNMKIELEDLSLRYIDPIAYREIAESINQKKKERQNYIDGIIETISKKLGELGINAQVKGRAKHFYSIFKKMFVQNKSINEIYDLFAVRAIVDSVKDCYAVLGMVHELYYPIPGRFKDYIAMPKPNMYQSLHTTVIGPNGAPFEIQIRTWEMHKVAELGIAAHWKYKEGVSGATQMDDKLAWLRQILEIQSTMVDNDEFMNSLKIDLFNDEVFVFTPKGDVINMPAGSTPIDFAFMIHSAIGCKMSGAKINGKIATLDTVLQNGDIVEVMTSSSVHGPSRDWLKICKTSQARTKINQWFKRERREENIIRGKEMIDKELKRLNITVSQMLRPEWVEPLIKKYTLSSIDDLYASVGYGGLSVNKVISRLREEYRLAQKNEQAQAETSNLPEVAPPIELQKRRYNSNNGIIVEGLDNCLVRLSRCCNPVPGDNIVGYITRGRGVSVHRADCTNIKPNDENEKKRLIKVYWEDEAPKESGYLTELQILANDRRGLLAEITKTLFDLKISINSVNSRTTKDLVAIINVTMEIDNKEQLGMISKKLKNVSGVFDVKRNKN